MGSRKLLGDDGHTWQRFIFSVPDTVSDERVRLVQDSYIKRAGEFMEKAGFRVLQVTPPAVKKQAPWDPPGRRVYVFYVRAFKRPEVMHFEVPDIWVPHLENEWGFKAR